MHSQIRSNTKKPPTRRLSRGSKSRARKRAVVAPAPMVADATQEELSRLADDLAYFRAERFREVEEGDVREEDVRRAETEIAALLKREDTA